MMKQGERSYGTAEDGLLAAAAGDAESGITADEPVLDYFRQPSRDQDLDLKQLVQRTGLTFVALFFATFMATYSWSNYQYLNNKSYSAEQGVKMTALFSLDSCKTTPTFNKAECCTSRSYPVLGGVDVVAFQQLPAGSTPVLGKIDFAAGLATDGGTYYFFFVDTKNRDAFLADPWRYTPKWGGFDSWAMAESRTLKGSGAQSQLGPNTDLGSWQVAPGGGLALFAGEAERGFFAAQTTHYAAEADRKWAGWFPTPESGVFNTRCFAGLTSEELEIAQDEYLKNGIPDKAEISAAARAKAAAAAGAVPGGGGGGGGGEGMAAQLRTASTDRVAAQARRRGDAEAQVYVVNAGATRIERAAVERGTGAGFRQDVLLQGFSSPKDVALDEPAGMMYYTDMVHAEVRRCPVEGAASFLGTELLVAGTVKPALLRLDPGHRVLYFTDQVCEGCDPETKLVLRAPMDGLAAGEAPEVVVRLEGHARGIDVGDDGYLYYTDFYEGTLSRVPLTPWGTPNGPREVVCDQLVEASYMDWSSAAGGPRVYWSEASGTQVAYVDLTEAGALKTKKILVDGASGYLDMVMATPSGLYWTDKVGYVVRAADLPGLLAAAAPPRYAADDGVRFATVLEGLDKPKGLWVASYPAAAGLGLAARTAYTDRGDAPVFEDYPWAVGPVVEPHRAATLAPSDPVEGREYEWRMLGRTYRQPSLKILLKSPREVAIGLREIDPATGAVTREYRGGVTCKYVRREVKGLLDEDREAFFAAMATLIDVPEAEGRERYGEGYRDMAFYVSRHHMGAGARECDHMHHGMGFLFQHVGLTLEFEQGLQVVDPAVTVPYWDFTVEGTDLYFRERGWDEAVRASVLFSPEWFGTADGATHTVTEGRWAHKLRIPGDQWGSDVPHNSYGLMRSPWNNNNAVYAQRYPTICGIPVTENTKWPQCADHHAIMTTKYSWSRYAYAVGGAPHGPVHGFLGGTFYSEAAYDSLADIMTPDDLRFLKTHTFNSPKNLWRKGLSNCPERCELDTPMEDCKCTCGADLMEKLEDSEALEEYFYTATAGGYKQLHGEYTDDERRTIVQTICEAGTAIGDQLESASPADLIFWILHPTVDRLHQWRIRHVAFTEVDWPVEDSYRGSVYKDLPQRCDGHGPTDTLLWRLNLDDGDRLARQYTNLEMFEITDPLGGYKMPYVYDNFKWDHCLEEGYDLVNIVGEQ